MNTKAIIRIKGSNKKKTNTFNTKQKSEEQKSHRAKRTN